MKKLFILAFLLIATPALAETKKDTPAPPAKDVAKAAKAQAKPAATVTKTTPKKAPAPAKTTPKKEAAPPLFSVDSAAQPAPPANSALARILETQQLRVCVRSDVPPFGYFTNKGLNGFDISLATEIATRLSIDYKKNLHVRWTVITAGARITSLQQKSCDLVLAAFSYTEARSKLVGFSKVYLQTDKVLVAPNKLTRKIAVIARVKGTTGKIEGIKGIVRYFNNYQEIINAMEEGSVDYIISDRPIALHMIRSVTQPYKITKTLAKNAERYAAGINKAHTHLHKAVNKALTNLAQNGRLAYLHRQWL